MHLGHWVTSMEAIYQITCSFLWSHKRLYMPTPFSHICRSTLKRCKYSLMCNIVERIKKLPFNYRTLTRFPSLCWRLEFQWWCGISAGLQHAILGGCGGCECSADSENTHKLTLNRKPSCAKTKAWQVDWRFKVTLMLMTPKWTNQPILIQSSSPWPERFRASLSPGVMQTNKGLWGHLSKTMISAQLHNHIHRVDLA